jgi:hypothetical protein
LHTPIFFSIRATCPADLVLLDFVINRNIFGSSTEH